MQQHNKQALRTVNKKPMQIAGKSTIMNPAVTHKEKSQLVSNSETVKILIAEDEDSGYRVFERILNGEGFEVIRAVNGKEAVEIALSDKYIQLIIMDIKMPELNGVEATRIIHHAIPELPIIATSAFTMPGDKKVYFEAGCIDYIPKPIRSEALISMVKCYVNK